MLNVAETSRKASIPRLLGDPTSPRPHLQTVELDLFQQRVSEGVSPSENTDRGEVSEGVSPSENTRLATRDYELALPARLDPGADLQQPERLLPQSLLANLQSSFDIFRQYCDALPSHWSSGQKRLPIFADYGQGAAAHYSGGGMDENEAGLYFYHQEGKFTGLSGEVAIHEGGHAILDRFRPRYRLEGGLEVEAFSESFGDLLSLFVHLRDPQLAAQVLEQTGGDLRRSNEASRFGEQLAGMLGRQPYLRDAVNSLQWQDPASLPPADDPQDPGKLSAEVHNFSRIWTGANYDIFCRLVEELSGPGKAGPEAVTQAAEQMLALYGKLLSRTAPQGNFRFREMAQALLEADRLLAGGHQETIARVLLERKILEHVPTTLELVRQDPSLGLPPEKVSLEIEDSRRTRDFELGQPFQPGSVEANVLGQAQHSWDLFAPYCSDVPPHWAHGESRLPLYPDWDLGFNCFYSNGHSADMQKPGLYFAHKQDPVTGEMVYSGLSSELITHEGGHAVLDRFRPQWGMPGNWSFESSAFQEAFCDVLAMLLEARTPGMAEKALEQTAGDLRRHNLISDFAEQFGQGINHSKLGDSGGPWLRTALNDRKWYDASQDPKAEAHDFGQIWSGASYDILCRISDRLQQQGMEPAEALRQAAEEMLKCYGTFVSSTAPEGKFGFRDAAHSLMQADLMLGSRWGGTIQEVMKERGILA